MAIEIPVDVAGRTVTVREMTVTEVRDWVSAAERGVIPADAAGHAAFDDCGIYDIAIMCDADYEWLAGQVPSDLEPLAAACRKANPHFFRVRAVMQAAHVAQVRAILAGTPPPQ